MSAVTRAAEIDADVEDACDERSRRKYASLVSFKVCRQCGVERKNFLCQVGGCATL